ncbi:MAG: DUF5989 family protein [Planctomycetota bacterium]
MSSPRSSPQQSNSSPPIDSGPTAPLSSATEVDARKFAAAAEERARGGLIADFTDFLRDNKKWWLIPILLALLMLAGLILLGGSPLAPFIYPLF